MASRTPKSAREQPKPSGPQILDSSNSGRQLWLVKVPKYLAQAWENAEEENVAKIFITKDASKLHVRMKTTLPPNAEAEIPTEYDIILRPVTDQKMAVISSPPDQASLAMDGHFNRRADARPAAGGKEYMRLKINQIEKACKPLRTVMRTDRVTNFKPISHHVNEVEYEAAKKKTEVKKLRDDKDVVTERILSAFENHQYYSLKDLGRLTDQPQSFIKEICRELCNYNTSGEHRNMYELKPEYRHYK